MIEEFLEAETFILLNNNDPTRHVISIENFFKIDLSLTNTNSTTLYSW